MTVIDAPLRIDMGMSFVTNRWTKDPQRGRDVPPTSIKLSEEERARYIRAAQRAGMTLSEWIRRACEAYVQERQRNGR